MKKILMMVFTCVSYCMMTMAQMVNPVHFNSQMKTLSPTEAEIVFSAQIDNGWHVYSTDIKGDGPIVATFKGVKMDGVEAVGQLRPVGNVVRKFDNMFGMEVAYFENKATFVQKVRFTKPQYDIDCYLEYGACNDMMCLPPTQVDFKKKGEVKLPKTDEMKDEKAEEKTENDEAEMKPETADTAVVMPAAAAGITDGELWKPVVKELQAMGGAGGSEGTSLAYILLMGIVGGLLAVCMPCIWPIIPMTVSFFMKRAKDDRRKGIRDAVCYGISIVVIYLGLGLVVTALFGSDALNALSTNAVFNVALFVLLVVFALSFFGWFELQLPDKWANAVDAKAVKTSGYVSIFLMAFTLVLVSFSCTAPIVGMLLVETATTGNWLAPAVGMLGFAVALALPFTLFALFPSWLKQAPKSGAWMNILKVTLGFIELAFALKFLSVADLAYGWHILDREVFLALWIVIFALLGAYLVGWLKFQSDGDSRKAMPVACVMAGILSLAFAVYMVPGLWGAPCKAVSAFAPPMSTQDFKLGTKTVEAHYTDYETGMAAARAAGKPVLIDFTGYGCVNCRKMEAAVWTDPRVAELLSEDYVLISLYVDDKAPLAEPYEVTDVQGNKKILRTVGAKWSYLQSHKFGSNAQPFYVLLDTDGNPLSGSRGYDEDVDGYLEFLREGLDRMKE